MTGVNSRATILHLRLKKNQRAEGKAAIDHLRKKVTTYQARLEEAEEVASRDALTGLRSRMSVEGVDRARRRQDVSR